MIKIRAKELLIDDFKKTYPNQKEWWDDWATKYSKKFASVVKTNTYAYHFTYAESDYSVTNILREEFKGIYLNKVMFKDDTIIKDYQQDLDNNFHPKGTTASSIIVHELGHALDDLIGLNDNKELNVYYKEVKNQIGTNLSRYAQTNIKEFLAEGFAEYIESSNPRPIAVAIGKFYEKVYNNYVEKVDRNDN